jgi:hypothetical protein
MISFDPASITSRCGTALKKLGGAVVPRFVRGRFGGAVWRARLGTDFHRQLHARRANGMKQVTGGASPLQSVQLITVE